MKIQARVFVAPLFIVGLLVSSLVSAEPIRLLCAPQHHIHSQLSGKFGRNIDCSKFADRYPDRIGCSIFELNFDPESSSAQYSISSHKEYYDVKKTDFDYKFTRSTMDQKGGIEVVIRIDRKDLTFSYKHVQALYSPIVTFVNRTTETGWCIQVDIPENKI